MNCSGARKAVYPSPERCALTVQTAHAMEHVRECPDCQRYFEGQTECSRLLRMKAGTEPAPEALRERVAGMIERHELVAPRRTRRRVVAAGVLLALAPGLWVASHFRSKLLFRAMCEDHAKYINAESQLRSSETAQIESWFRDKTDFSVRVPVLTNADVVGGRLCFLRGRKAALVLYRHQSRPVSLFQLNSRDVSLTALDRSEVDGAPIWRASWKGYSLAAFEQRGVVYALVSDMRESELLEMASAAQIKARGY
jgi:anti-sigma factor RsiW